MDMFVLPWGVSDMNFLSTNFTFCVYFFLTIKGQGMLVLHLSGHQLAGESLCTIHSLLRKHLSLNNARRTDLPHLPKSKAGSVWTRRLRIALFFHGQGKCRSLRRTNSYIWVGSFPAIHPPPNIPSEQLIPPEYIPCRNLLRFLLTFSSSLELLAWEIVSWERR